MKWTLKITGGPELAATLNALPLRVRRKTLHRLLRAAAEPMRARMSQLAPRAPGAPDLKENIGVSVATRIGSVAGGRWEARDEFQAAVAVGPTKEFFYGLYQEYGTVFHSPQPFARPAFDGTADQVLWIFQQGIWQELRAGAEGRSPTGGSGGTR